jgi:hypothetical protein
MRKWLVSVLLFALIFLPPGVGAQGETKLDAINIHLWSEYDQPSMLVIYQFIVSQDTPLPAEVTLRFPKNSNLVAVAVEDNGEWLNKDFMPPAEGENWQTITIKAETYKPHRIEYYQPLRLDGNKREFKFHWFGDYYVKAFTVNILVPGDSSELVTSPALESSTTSPDGLVTSGTVTKTDLKTMNSFKFELEYQRTSTSLIDPPDESTTQVQPAAPVNEDTPGRVSIANLPWIIGVFGLALIGIALFSYWRSTQSGEGQPRKRRRQKTEDTAEEGQAYCHECGARAHAGDRFCRTCGSRLRAE